MEITVKKARSEDVPVLSTIAQLTFQLAGPLDSSKTELAKYIAENLNESVFQKLVESDEVFVACAQSGLVFIAGIVERKNSILSLDFEK